MKATLNLHLTYAHPSPDSKSGMIAQHLALQQLGITARPGQQPINNTSQAAPAAGGLSSRLPRAGPCAL
eukprot:3602777-Pyramimonas_sp.AAC.1